MESQVMPAMPRALPGWMEGLWTSIGKIVPLLETLTGHRLDTQALAHAEEQALVAWAATILPQVLSNPAVIPTLIPQALGIAIKTIWDNVQTIFPSSNPALIQPELHAAMTLFKMNPMTGQVIT